MVDEGAGAIRVRFRDMAVARSCRVLTIMEGALTLTQKGKYCRVLRRVVTGPFLDLRKVTVDGSKESR